jgi:hypothetical protein
MFCIRVLNFNFEWSEAGIPYRHVFQFSFESPILKIQENQAGLELFGTHHLVLYADNLNYVKESKRYLLRAMKIINTSRTRPQVCSGFF